MKSGIGNNYSDLIGYISRSPRARTTAHSGLKPSPRLGATSNAGQRKSRLRKQTEMLKKEIPVYKKPNLNHTEYAYREAVNRLKCMLSDSYSSCKINSRRHGYESDETDNVSVIERPALSEISKYIPPSGLSRYNSARRYYSPHTYGTENNPPSVALKPAESIASLQPNQYVPSTNTAQAVQTVAPPPELLQFIEKQEGYIEQLERESQFCRGELSNILGKVKDVISENEVLTEQAKLGIIRSDTSESGSNDFDFRSVSKERREKIPLSGPNIVFESRISELEAQLAQADIDVKKLTQENNQHKQKLANNIGDTGGTDVYKRQIDILQRDKKDLEDTVRKLQGSIDSLKETDAQNFSKSLRTRDLAEHSAFEKSQADIEIRRLKDELERQHSRVREMQHEMTKKIAEERSMAERRYNYQVDQLGGDLSNQWETASRLQLELERQKRVETDYRRDLAQKNSQIDDLRSELKQKTASLLSDVAQVNAEKQSLEQEITSLRLQLERAERQSKVESSRLNAEIISLRQRLDRGDSDLLQSKRENLRLSDQVAALEKEITLGDLNRETRPSKELTKLMSDMEAKHVSTVSELEGMVQGQRQLMEKLTAECKTLTRKLEDTTLKHKQEMNTLQSNVNYLTNKISNNNDRIGNENTYKYEQDITNQAPVTISPPLHSGNEQLYEYTSPIEQHSSVSPTTSITRYDTNGRSSSQSIRRESLLRDLPQRRSSQQSYGQPVEIISTSNIYDSDNDKYTKDSVETEKPKSNRTSPTGSQIRRKSSIRFSDEIQLPSVQAIEQQQSYEQQQPQTKLIESDGTTAYAQSGGYTGQDTYSQPTRELYATTNIEQQQQQPYESDYISPNQYEQQPSNFTQPVEYDGQYEQQYDGNIAQYDPIQQYQATTNYDTTQEFEPNGQYELQQQPQPQPQYDPNTQYGSTQQFSRRSSQQYSPNQKYSPTQQYSSNQQYNTGSTTYDTNELQSQYAPDQQRYQRSSVYDTSSAYEQPYQTENQSIESKQQQPPQQPQQQQQKLQSNQSNIVEEPSSASLSSNSESIASNSNLGSKYKGNGQKPKLLSKQPSKKKIP